MKNFFDAINNMNENINHECGTIKKINSYLEHEIDRVTDEIECYTKILL